MLYRLVKKKFREAVYTRYDELPYVFLFRHSDFDGLKREPFTVKSSLGHNLQGYFHYYDNPIKNRLIVFDHGMYGGHRSYMREIEMLCKHGYLVYAYDHTGCLESGGETTGGFSQSLRDLDEVIAALKEVPELKGYEFSVVGHSWGGFATLNIPRFHPEIKKIVALSGFISPKEIIYQHAKGLFKLFVNRVYKNEVAGNPKYMECSAIDTLANSDTEALIFHSPNDHMVNYQRHFLKLKDALGDRKNLTFVTVEGGDHNPNYTKAALLAKQDFQAKLRDKLKSKALNTKEECKEFVDSLDWYQITEQNDEVWTQIFEFLD